MRSQGMPEAELRANLMAQGWTKEDLDEAFRASPEPYSPNASRARSGIPKWVIWLVVLLIVLPLLFWGLIWGAGMFGLYGLERIIPDSLNGYNSPSSEGSLSLCGNWPEDDAVAKANFVKGAMTRTGIADGFPIYPASISIGKMQSAYPDIYGEEDMCSPDSGQRIIDFYLKEGSTQGWKFQTAGVGDLKFNDTDANGTKVIPQGALLLGEPDSKNGSYVMLNIFRDADHTVIRIHYGNNGSSTSNGTPTPANNSTVPRNTHVGSNFTIPIPPLWQVSTAKLEGVDFAMTAPPEQNFTANIIISASDVPDTTTAESAAKAAKAAEQKDYVNYKIILETPITIGYLPAYQITFSWHNTKYDLDITQAQIFLKNRNTMYTITATSLSNLYGAYKPTFQSSINDFVPTI